MSKKAKQILISAIVVITLLMLAIAFVPGAEKIVPAPVYSFASKFYASAIGVTIAVIGLLVVASSPVVGVGLILIGAFIIWQNLKGSKVE